MAYKTVRSNPVPGVSFDPAKNRAKQSFKDECDINTIVSKYTKTGVLPSGNRRALWGDFSSGEDFRIVQNKIAGIRSVFDSLNSDIRAKFANNPENLLDFLANPENNQEAIELGLLDVSDKSPVATPAGATSEPEKAVQAVQAGTGETPVVE